MMFKIFVIATFISNSGGSNVSITHVNGSWNDEASCNATARVIESAKAAHYPKMAYGQLVVTATCYKVDKI